MEVVSGDRSALNEEICSSTWEDINIDGTPNVEIGMKSSSPFEI